LDAKRGGCPAPAAAEKAASLQNYPVLG